MKCTKKERKKRISLDKKSNVTKILFLIMTRKKKLNLKISSNLVNVPKFQLIRENITQGETRDNIFSRVKL